MMMRQRLNGRFLMVFAALAVVAGCSQPDQGWAPQPPAVDVAEVQAAPLALSSELPGRVEPVRVAEVRARVAGIVLKRTFEEGADVKAGDVLFRIDPAPFEVALSRAQSELARSEAALFDAKSVIDRYESLVRTDAVSRQQYDSAQAALKMAEAGHQSAQAEVRNARLNLDYATVRAPIAGRIGRALVSEGALVGQGEATPLALIQQLDPVYVDFRQPVSDVMRMQQALAEGRLQQEGSHARIEVLADGLSEPRSGRLLFSDAGVDRDTGQVLLRGEVANADGLLMPGLYVRVRIDQGQAPDAILVPQRAVRRSTDGKPMVLVIAEGDVAEARPVRTGAMQGGQWHIIEGLQPGERIIVNGQPNPGDQVTITGAAETAPETNEQN